MFQPPRQFAAESALAARQHVFLSPASTHMDTRPFSLLSFLLVFSFFRFLLPKLMSSPQVPAKGANFSQPQSLFLGLDKLYKLLASLSVESRSVSMQDSITFLMENTSFD